MGGLKSKTTSNDSDDDDTEVNKPNHDIYDATSRSVKISLPPSLIDNNVFEELKEPRVVCLKFEQ